MDILSNWSKPEYLTSTIAEVRFVCPAGLFTNLMNFLSLEITFKKNPNLNKKNLRSQNL
jgi:hypothetical protein